MPRGYRRLRVQGCGAGASEHLRAMLHAFDRGETGPYCVGEVRRVFDRSAYLELAPDALDVPATMGPLFVLLAGVDFDGPLAVRLVGDEPGGFTPDGLAAGDACRLRSAASRRESAAYVLSVGDTLDLELDEAALDGNEPDPNAVRNLSTLTSDDVVSRRARAALDVLGAHGATDGLGWLDELRGLAAGERPSDDLRDLIDWWASALDGGATPTDPPTAILGRGPGATPSGDDVVAGLLVALHRTTDGTHRRRVRAAGEAVVGAAPDRTTTVSAALLAQAARGRAAGRIEAAVTDLFTPDGSDPDWPSTVRAAADVGHTSGVDHLVGVLLVPLGIGPRLGTTG